jgi:hypothetical protein
MPAPSTADVASEANGLLTGLGILTIQIFPIALPLLVLVVAPLALLAVIGLLLAGILMLPVWLARIVFRGRAAGASRSRPRSGTAQSASRSAWRSSRASSGP